MPSIVVATDAGPAEVELTAPREPRALLVITHGAAGGTQARDLLAVRDACAGEGIAVALLTQPFRAAGRRSPPKPEAQDAAWVQAVTALRRRRGLGTLPLVLGGRSNGARVACRTAGRLRAAAVVALAFPLHVPGNPARSRLAELDAAGVPVLVVQGDRDAFGMPPAAGDRTVVVVPGADHSLKRDLPVIASAVAEFVRAVSG